NTRSRCAAPNRAASPSRLGLAASIPSVIRTGTSSPFRGPNVSFWSTCKIVHGPRRIHPIGTPSNRAAEYTLSGPTAKHGQARGTGRLRDGWIGGDGPEARGRPLNGLFWAWSGTRRPRSERAFKNAQPVASKGAGPKSEGRATCLPDDS